MATSMSISEMETSYRQLQEQLLHGELELEEFKAQVEKLRYTDDLGQQWSIGWYTGKWYRYEAGQWVEDTPAPQDPEAHVAPVPTPETLALAEEGRRRRPASFWLAIALAILLVLAIATLILGVGQGWWIRPAADTTAVAAVAASDTPAPATETTQPEATSTTAPTTAPSATKRPTSTPSRTPRATVRPTSTTQPKDSPTPRSTSPTQQPTRATDQVTSSPEPSASPTARPTAPTTAPSTKTADLTGRIYFPVHDPEAERQTVDIHSVNLATGARQVVASQASQPALSPDGKRLAYRSWDGSQRGLLVRELAEGNTWVLVQFHEAARPSWSPDSQYIVYPSQQEPDRYWRLYRTFGLDSDRVRRHGADIFGRVPIWLADGRIVYWECPGGKCGLYAIGSDGTGLVRLTTRERDTAPAGSPDGSKIAFMSDRDGNWEIYVTTAHPPGGEAVEEPLRLTRNGARDGLPTWSPDGKWLAFVSDRDGGWAIWATRPDGSSQQKLFDLGGSLEGEIADVVPADQHGWTWETIAWGR
jgi:TolB protein